MSEKNKRIARRFYEEMINKGDLKVADEIIATNYVNHNPPPGAGQGREGVKAFITKIRAGFPDLTFTIEDQIAEGEKVMTRYVARGTHKGEAFGIPATGKPGSFSGIVLMRIANDQVQEVWVNWDALGLFKQLGAIPEPLKR